MHVNCSTCLELLSPSADLSSAPCGHVFHSTCILQWLETGKNTCPQCRSKCRENQLRRIYFTEGVDVPTDVDATYLQQQLDSLTFQLRCAKSEKEKLQENFNDVSAKNIGLKEEYKDLEIRFKESKDSLKYANEQAKQFQREKKKASDAQNQVTELRNELKLYELIQASVKDSLPAMKERLHSMGDYSENTKQLILLTEELKKELTNKSADMKRLSKELQQKSNECANLKYQVEQSAKTVSEYTTANKKLRDNLQMLEEHNEKLSRQSHENDSEELENFFPNIPKKLVTKSPKVSKTVKECGIVGIKRTLSCQDNSVPVSLFKKSKASTSSSQPSASFYNGFGGHSKPEISSQFELNRRPRVSQTKPKPTKPTTESKKIKTLNKYFNFDTP